MSPPRWAAFTAGLVTAVEVGLAWRFGATAVLPAFCYLGAVLTMAAVVDARTLKIPNVLLLPSYPIGVTLLAVAAGVDGQWWPLARAGIATVAVLAFYLALALAAGGHQLGPADVILGGLTGLLLGWVSWSALSTGVVLGWVVALVVVVARRCGRPAPTAVIAAGPCLWLGAFIALLATR